MTVLGRLLASEERAMQSTAWGDWGGTRSATAAAGVSVTSSVQLLTVYGCNRFICDGISTLPVDVYRRLADGSPVLLSTPDLFHEPAPGLDFIAWATQVLTSLLLAGNAYLWLSYDTEGRLTSMTPLDPTRVQVHRDHGRKGYRVAGVDVDPYTMRHIPGVMYPGADVGMSPVEAARQNIGLGISAEEFGNGFFDRGQTLSGVIEVSGELTPAETRDMARSWARKHSGKDKAHLPAVLQGGAQWKPTGVTNEQAQFLETRQFTASQIAGQMFLIDPTEMGLPVQGSSITYANLEQRNARKVQVTFLPWIIRMEKFLSSLLAQPRYVKLNVGGLLRGDMKTRFDSYRVALGPTTPFMTADEARHFEDWPDMPDTPTDTPPEVNP